MIKLDRDKIIMIAAAAAALVFGVLYFTGINSSRVDIIPSRGMISAAETAIENPFVSVHVAGEVKYPGVYELAGGSRIRDALELAGGPSEFADLNRINLASYVTDAQQILIPRARAENEPDYYDENENYSKLVNINTADLRTLMTLPGVGEVTAGNIIAYREKNGRFNSVSDIKNVPRIGERTFETLCDLITVE